MRCVAAVGGLRGCGVVRWELQKAEEYVSCDGGSSNASLRSRRVVWVRSLVDGTFVECRVARECPQADRKLGTPAKPTSGSTGNTVTCF